ncbi:hypothetical protein ACEPPN_016241 [Leptodophora sp. 'Broadleaf-Isolate-01']
MSTNKAPVLITGAAGRVGGVGKLVVELLRASGLPVRALVRRDDERAAHLRGLGAEVVVVDLTKSEEVLPAVQGCRLVFFSTSVSSNYLEATAVMAAAARACPGIELLVNLSQMTVGTMDLTHVTESPQQRLQWLSEQVLNWSGVPVTHLRPTVFQENPLFWGLAAKSIADSGAIALPFGRGRTNPVAVNDVAEVAAAILLEPSKYVGKAVELTGPRSVDMYDLVEEYSAALGRHISYVEIPLETWEDKVLKQSGLPDHAYQHVATMAKLHETGDYDRFTNSVQEVLGRPAASISATIKARRSNFPIPLTT